MVCYHRGMTGSQQRDEYIQQRTLRIIKRYRSKDKYRNLSAEQVQMLAEAEARMDWVKRTESK